MRRGSGRDWKSERKPRGRVFRRRSRKGEAGAQRLDLLLLYGHAETRREGMCFSCLMEPGLPFRWIDQHWGASTSRVFHVDIPRLL